MNKTLHMMVGLPRSGKSTQAKLLGYPVVEPDAIRQVIHGTPWKPNVEPLVWAHAHVMVEALFEAGHSDVTLDAVNHTHARRSLWVNHDWVVKHHLVDTDADTCIERAKATQQNYLIPVIQRIARDFEPVGGAVDC